MSIQLHENPRTNTILLAALAIFPHYGFKRATMADIATKAKISRPALYLKYGSKGAVFTALAQALANDALELANQAWPTGTPFAEGLARSAIALSHDTWRLVDDAPHASELLLGDSADLAGVNAHTHDSFTLLIAQRMVEADYSDALAGVIAAALFGIQQKAKSEAERMLNIRAFARMIEAGLKL
jgi:AcrR family transcriptional regulator